MAQRAIKSQDLKTCVQHLTTALGYSQDIRSVVEENVERALHVLFSTPRSWDEPGVVVNDEVQVGSSPVADAILSKLTYNTEGGYFEDLEAIKDGVAELHGALIDVIDGVRVPKLRGIADDLSAVKGQFDNTSEITLSAEVSNIRSLISQKDVGLVDKITGIESKIEDIPKIKQSTDSIESEVKNTDYGLNQIRLKVNGLDTLLQDSTYGLNKLKELIDSISSSLSSSVSGLAAIRELVNSNNSLIRLLPTQATLESKLSDVTANDNANKKAITDLITTTEKQYLLQTQNTVTETISTLMESISQAQSYCVTAYEDWVALASRIATKEIQVSASSDGLQAAIEDAIDLVNSLDSIREIVISFSDIVSSTKGLSDAAINLMDSANKLLPFMEESVSSNKRAAEEMAKVNDSVTLFVQNMNAAKITAEQISKFVKAYSDVEAKKLEVIDKHHNYDSKLDVANTISGAIEAIVALRSSNKKEIRL